jgi:fructose-1-phosphate kinase PfkB-like protein
MQFLTICMNPTLQKTLLFPSLAIDEVNRTERHWLDASGKGVNVSRTLTLLGERCLHLTALGGPLRNLFLALCEQDKVKVEWVESGSPIRFCYTVLSQADKSVTELVEEAEPVRESAEDRLAEAYTRLLPAFDWVIISGTKAKGYSGKLIPFMTERAKDAGKKVILDVRGDDLVNSLPFNPDVIKPNLSEFCATFNIPLDNKPQIQTKCLELCEKYKARIVLTRGKEPLWFTEPGAGGSDWGEYPGEPPDDYAPARFEPLRPEPSPSADDAPLNTTGCGDAFTAGLASALSKGETFGNAAIFASRCAAKSAGLIRPGAI